MQRERFRFIQCAVAMTVVAMTVIAAGTVCLASRGSLPVTLPNILKNGQAAAKGTQTQFNYVLKMGNFHGSAKAKVSNASNTEQKYKNVGYLSGVTIQHSLYTVSPKGSAVYTASGTVQ